MLIEYYIHNINNDDDNYKGDDIFPRNKGKWKSDKVTQANWLLGG